VLISVLALAALAAGVTGAWSPCGFSMVETLAPAGYAGRLRTTLVACATFTLGALAGGVVTFGGLGLLGQAIGAGGTGAAAVAAVIAVAAAAGEARGLRIVPQVRRQVPESWRRVMPVPLAAGLYGVLLGLGFTTFILTFAVWALAAVSVALGEPAIGAVLGLAFGAGRALPVIALAPVAETDRGNAAHAAMAERPAILRGLRVADAVALAACAAAMVGVAPANAATIAAASASGPASAGNLFAFQRPGGPGYLRRPDATVALPGRDPALGGSLVGWRDGDRIVLADPGTLAPVATYDSPGGGAFAFSDQWVVWRVGTAQLVAQPRSLSAPPRVVATARVSEQLGRPALAGSTLVYHRAGRAGAQIRLLDLASGGDRLLRAERRALLSNPSFDGSRLLYVRSTYTRQELRLGPPARRRTTRDQVLYSTTPTARRDAEHEKGHHRHGAGYPHGRAPRLPPRPPPGVTDTLWTTALGVDAAYVTRLRLRGGTTTATVLSVPR
jgi:hypothetical protein